MTSDSVLNCVNIVCVLSNSTNCLPMVALMPVSLHQPDLEGHSKLIICIDNKIYCDFDCSENRSTD